jgi:hypothetical protein
MKNINRNFQGDRLACTALFPSLEIAELEIANFGKRHKIQYVYPRHVCFNGITVDRSLDIKPLGDRKNCDRHVNFKDNFYLVSDEIVNNLHLENLRQNLDKRLQAAKNKGDDRLVNLLEKEFQQLIDRSTNCQNSSNTKAVL